jgi:RNA polymerase sigma factor (TIGR02999 family)
MAAADTSDLTALLKAWGRGDLAARDELMPAVYEELRRRARAYFRQEPVGNTLQPTALVHEVYLRLIRQDRAAWQNRAQFYGVAAQMMRRILVDPARARNDGEAVRAVGTRDARGAGGPSAAGGRGCA